MNGLMTTDEMLELLSTIGKPTIRRMDSGWYAGVELPAPKGVSADVRSDFGHSTHQSALIELLDRLGAVQGVGEKIEHALEGMKPGHLLTGAKG